MLSPDRRDVIDPIGGSLETYRSCARQIREHLAARIATLELPAAGGSSPGGSPSPSDESPCG
jgi:hypothetical protein